MVGRAMGAAGDDKDPGRTRFQLRSHRVGGVGIHPHDGQADDVRILFEDSFDRLERIEVGDLRVKQRRLMTLRLKYPGDVADAQ